MVFLGKTALKLSAQTKERRYLLAKARFGLGGN